MSNAYHKAKLMQLLSAVADNSVLRSNLRFKGGTCALMLGYLDRFSVDLDFDIINESKIKSLRPILEKVFKGEGFEIRDQSLKVLEFNLKYQALPNERNTLRFDALGTNYKNNIYENVMLPEINRYFGCQTVETMFSHKLMALMERFDRHRTIAGRDIYDIHYFFLTGRNYLPGLIKERTGQTVQNFFLKLKDFVEKRATTEILVMDLGYLLPADKMRFVKKNLLLETIMFINDEIKRIS